MFCMKCGTPLPDDANFCFECGCDLRNLSQSAGTEFSAVEVGDYVKFGRYPQKKNETTKEPIEWLVLDVKDDYALIFSCYGLDYKRYHHEYVYDITWENSDLRKWLNDEFLQIAFSDEELKRIRLSTVVNEEFDGGNNTQDRVFCLSVAEAERYFRNADERKCEATDYAYNHGVWIWLDTYSGFAHRCYWWLRSPGDGSWGPGTAAIVLTRGAICLEGYYVDNNGYAVRPALWLNLKSFKIESFVVRRGRCLL